MSWKIGGVFGRSPFGPIHEHMAKAQACVDLLPPLTEAFVAGRAEEVCRLGADVHRYEHEADLLKNEIRARLTTSMFSLAEREEIMTILRAQDDVADRTEDAVRLMELRSTAVPEPLRDELLSLVNRVREATQVVTGVEAHLDRAGDLTESDMIRQARADLERFGPEAHEINVTASAALADIFKLERALDPVSVVFLMQVVHLVGSICDAAENAADVLSRMVARR